MELCAGVKHLRAKSAVREQEHLHLFMCKHINGEQIDSAFITQVAIRLAAHAHRFQLVHKTIAGCFAAVVQLHVTVLGSEDCVRIPPLSHTVPTAKLHQNDYLT